MHPFIETLSIAGGIGLVIVLGVVLLTFFHRLVSWWDGDKKSADSIAIKGLLEPDTLATVHLNGGREILSDVRLIGFTNAESLKGRFPLELHGMLVLEDATGQRIFVRAKNIKMIVAAPKNPSPA